MKKLILIGWLAGFAVYLHLKDGKQTQDVNKVVKEPVKEEKEECKYAEIHAPPYKSVGDRCKGE
jgi:hypothetical protein